MPRAALGPKRFIAIAGNMGAGKSTLVDFLQSQYSLDAYYEPNDENPYLTDFYQDMKRWSFQSQVFFLSKKFSIHQNLTASSAAVIQDRTIYEDAEIFAENLYRQRKMSKRDYLVYRELYSSIIKELRPPDLMIYLTCSVKTLRKRIRLRGRPEEQQLPRSYLLRLQSLYDEWFERYKLSKTLVINSDKLDYLDDLFDQFDLFKQIEKALR
jgi:deoxyadenosine/deoxycytidine kinase